MRPVREPHLRHDLGDGPGGLAELQDPTLDLAELRQEAAGEASFGRSLVTDQVSLEWTTGRADRVALRSGSLVTDQAPPWNLSLVTDQVALRCGSLVTDQVALRPPQMARDPPRPGCPLFSRPQRLEQHLRHEATCERTGAGSREPRHGSDVQQRQLGLLAGEREDGRLVVVEPHAELRL